MGRLALFLAILLAPVAVWAQSTAVPVIPGHMTTTGCAPGQQQCFVPFSTSNPAPTADANGAAFQGVVAITPGTPVTAARSLGYICTTAGNATLTLADGSTITLALTASTSFQTLPFAVTNITLSGAAGTFWNLK